MTKEEKRMQMLSLAEQWQQSGKSQCAFAREHELNLFTLRYWIRKRQQQQNEDFAFVQLNSPITTGSILVRYSNGIELHFPCMRLWG